MHVFPFDSNRQTSKLLLCPTPGVTICTEYIVCATKWPCRLSAPPKKTVMIYTPISDEWECLLFYPVINWVLPLKKKFSTIQLKKNYCFNCTSLTINEIKHFFVCLLAICISSVNCLFIFLAKYLQFPKCVPKHCGIFWIFVRSTMTLAICEILCELLAWNNLNNYQH